MVRLLALHILVVASLSAQSSPSWRLELIGRTRVDLQAPALLGNVTDIALRRDGGVYVAEENPARVVRYDARGELVRVMMRDGKGPGEVSRPEIGSVGDTLIAFDPAVHRLTWMSGSGSVLREMTVQVDYGEQRVTVVADGSVFIPRGGGPGYDGSAMHISPQGRMDSVTWHHPALDDLHIVWRGAHWMINARTPYAPRGAAVFDPAGRLVVGGSKRSQWFVIQGADTVKSVSLPDRAVAIPPVVKDSVFKAWFGRLPKFPEIDKLITANALPSTLPPWVSFDIDRAGRWWIGRPGADGQLASWDVVVNGKLTGHVAVPAPLLDIRYKGPIWAFGTDRVALIHENADGAAWVGIYRVVHPGPDQ